MQHHVTRASACLTTLLTVAEFKPALPQLSSDMLIIEIDRCTEWLTGMEEKLFDKGTKVL